MTIFIAGINNSQKQHWSSVNFTRGQPSSDRAEGGVNKKMYTMQFIH